MALEAPHARTGAREPRLHFVGDEQPAGGADGLDGGRQERRRIGIDTVAGEDRIHQQRCRTDAMAQHIVDGLLHPGGKPHADRRGIVPVGVGRAHGTHVDAQRHGLAQRGRHRGDSGRNAVVGQFRHDDAAGAPRTGT
ncbi:hypothetical protein G6F23_014813 [Rhizopus arrhizus]|nr:hypothetical protein G6F23_014813 [Rhizopus arrhizus]